MPAWLAARWVAERVIGPVLDVHCGGATSSGTLGASMVPLADRGCGIGERRVVAGAALVLEEPAPSTLRRIPGAAARDGTQTAGTALAWLRVETLG